MDRRPCPRAKSSEPTVRATVDAAAALESCAFKRVTLLETTTVVETLRVFKKVTLLETSTVVETQANSYLLSLTYHGGRRRRRRRRRRKRAHPPHLCPHPLSSKNLPRIPLQISNLAHLRPFWKAPVPVSTGLLNFVASGLVRRPITAAVLSPHCLPTGGGCTNA